LEEIKKLAEDKPIVVVNVIEILSEVSNPLIEEIEVTESNPEKVKGIVKHVPTVEELDDVTELLEN